MLYWMDGELDNAKACFRSAQIQDAEAENKEYASDYVLLDYLDGLATQKLGGDGSDAINRAKANAGAKHLPPHDGDANVLVFLEHGLGPAKYATGQYRQELRFAPRPSPVHSARISVSGQQCDAPPHDDLHFQATTRGGRVMDHILANKVVFKETSDTVGNASLIAAGALAMAGGDRNAALGLAAFGAASKLVSAATTPAADIRYWANLPQHLGIAALRVPPGFHTMVVQPLDEAGRPIASMAKTVRFEARP